MSGSFIQSELSCSGDGGPSFLQVGKFGAVVVLVRAHSV